MVGMAQKKMGNIPRSDAKRGRYFGALLEEINGKLSLLLEGYVGLDGRMGKLEERMELLENEMEQLENKMELLENRMDKLEVRIDGLEQKFEAFRTEANAKFTALFEGQQEFFEEMRQFHLRLTVLEGNK
jgi:chromosome segregation ATPase